MVVGELVPRSRLARRLWLLVVVVVLLQALLLERPLLLEQLLLLPLLPLLVHRLLLPPGIDLPLLVVLRQAGQGDSKAGDRHADRQRGFGARGGSRSKL